MIPEAIADVILADQDIRAQLATWVFTTGQPATPAVFCLPSIPEGCGNPSICVDGPVSGVPWGTRDSQGAEVQIDINIWANKGFSLNALRSLAWKVREVVNRATLSIPNYEEVGCIADPPRYLEDEQGFPGFNVGVKVRVLQL